MILAIESSCDESSLALFDPNRGLIAEWTHSQIALHREYGGVVPDLASREHLSHFVPLLERLRAETTPDSIREIAVTTGPGLAGCLAIGVALAKTLSLLWKVPIFGVNHLRGHAFSPFISLHHQGPTTFQKKYHSLLPHLGLIVSGGNTLLCTIEEKGVSVLAQTVDDAAGEALDKGAKLLGMAYPGGPLIEQQAIYGNSHRFDFPRAKPKSEHIQFSFSGLKTSLRYRLAKMKPSEVERDKADLCASYQQAVVDQLITKMAILLERDSFVSMGLSGGVANNRCLQHAFTTLAKKTGVTPLVAEGFQTGDNAGMIAFAKWIDPAHTQQGENVTFHPSLRL